MTLLILTCNPKSVAEGISNVSKNHTFQIEEVKLDVNIAIELCLNGNCKSEKKSQNVLGIVTEKIPNEESNFFSSIYQVFPVVSDVMEVEKKMLLLL